MVWWSGRVHLQVQVCLGYGYVHAPVAEGVWRAEGRGRPRLKTTDVVSVRSASGFDPVFMPSHG